MKHIKRLLACLLLAAMVLTMLVACSEEAMETPGEVSNFSSEKHFDINDLLQNGDGSGEDSGFVGTGSLEDPSAPADESSTGSTSEPVPSEQSGDETPPEESVTSTPEESQGAQTTSQNTTGQSSGGTTSQGATDKPTKPQETSGHSSGGTTSQGTTGQPSGELTGELVVSDKLYAYNGKNIMLLNVENKTSLNLDVTIKGKYLDANGNVIKEESQTYRGFPSGWKNYYIFHPRMAFASFDYTVEVKEFKATTELDQLYVSPGGELLSTYVTFTYEKYLYWIGTAYAKDMVFNGQLVNRHPNTSITWQGHFLILDANGEIYGTDYDYSDSVSEIPEKCFAGTTADPVGGYRDGKTMQPVTWRLPTDDLSVPENVQGKFTVIFAARSITNHDVSESWRREGKYQDVVIEGFTHN